MNLGQFAKYKGVAALVDEVKVQDYTFHRKDMRMLQSTYRGSALRQEAQKPRKQARSSEAEKARNSESEVQKPRRQEAQKLRR